MVGTDETTELGWPLISVRLSMHRGRLGAVRQVWAIYWTLGNFLKSLATINLSKSPTF